MKQFKTLTLFILLAPLIASDLKAQDDKKINFRSPLDIPLYLAGNFSELRGNHFHTGIDIKTLSVEGKAVYAIEDGYIARIKISTSGYGKAIYIRHPNGYTSVYGHLQKANPEIEKYIQNHQYKKESYTIELFPDKDELVVKKGDLIARSGNTGGSNGPHLHFEIRETNSEKPVNPLLFDFAITDNIRPIIKGIRIYPLSEYSYVSSYPGNSNGFMVSGNYGKYRLTEGQNINVFGEIGFAVHTYDLLNGYPNKCGVYTIRLIVDSVEVFMTKFEKLDFSTMRYINTYSDYYILKKYKKSYHKQFIGKNNKLKIYPTKVNNGFIKFNDGETHHIKYIINDSYNNRSEIEFTVNALTSNPENKTEKPIDQKAYFTVDGPNFYMDKNIIIDIPPFALYDNMSFNYKVLPPTKNTIGSVFLIGNEYIPLQKKITITFNNSSIPNGFEQKAMIVSIDEDGRLSNMGGELENGKLVLKTRSFGKYGLAIDSIAPKINPVNIFSNKDLSTYNTFSVKISDDLSGIKNYRGTIDNQWILMEYEPKKSTLTYRFDNEKVKSGMHQFNLEVTDGVGNTANYSVDFIR